MNSRERLFWWCGEEVGAVERLPELGYTAVVVPVEGVEVWRSSSLPVWVHLRAPTLSPLQEEYLEAVWEELALLPEEVHGVVWEVPERIPEEQERDQTSYDLLLRDLRVIEAAVADRALIYYPTVKGEKEAGKLAGWLSELLLDVAPSTTLAFSALAGGAKEEGSAAHPVWSEVSTTASHTRLLPVVNGGMVSHGEGLWPLYSWPRLEELLVRGRSPGIVGLAVLAPVVPLAGCTLDANLTVASAAATGGEAPRLLFEEWCENHGIDPVIEQELSLRIGQLYRDLCGLLSRGEVEEVVDAEPRRLRILSLLGQLNTLALEEQTAPGARQVLPYFIRDAKRLLYQHMQAVNVTLPNVFSGEDMKESFWTSMTAKGDRGISFGTGAKLLERPCTGEEGSIMCRIYRTTFPRVGAVDPALYDG